MSETTENCNVENDKEDGDPPDVFFDQLPEDVKNMWELPQIYEFLCLAKDTLHIRHLSMYEMERMLLIPKASKQLANIMTFLLSPSMPKSHLNKIPSMPYEFWTKFLLNHKVTSWFKVYQSKDCDSIKVLDAIGVEPEFWKIFPDASSISQRSFETLSVKQRIWLLKTVCDTLMHTKKSLQEEVANKYLDGEGEKLLGKDRYGSRYVYFPIFLDNDLRVYKHNLNNKILLNVTPVVPKLKNGIVNARKRRRDRRKNNRWKNGNLPGKPKKRPVPRIKVDEKCEIKIEQEQSNAGNIDNISNKDTSEVEAIGVNVLDDKNNEKIVSTTVNSNPNDVNEIDGQTLPDDVSNSSKTDDEKINEIMTSTNTVVNTEKENHVVSKSDDEKLIETKTSQDTDIKDELIINRDDRIKDEVGLKTWMKSLPENNNYDTSNNELCGEDFGDNFTDNVDQIHIESRTNSKREMESLNNILQDLSVSTFELVADNVNSLKNLVASLLAQNSNESTEQVRCEVLLIKKIRALINRLEPKQSALIESQKIAREKLMNEWKNFKNGTITEDECVEEGTRGSNEWVLGSQGCPLLSYGDSSHQDPLHHEDDGHEIDNEGSTKDKEANENDTQEFETRRVLRARGVSSYMEQFTSDDDLSSSEGEGWAEIVDPKTGIHIGLSSQPSPLKDRPAGEESGNTDSDQDWELPASRKRKNKRMSAGRRLKSFQARLQNIKIDPSITELLSSCAASVPGQIKTEMNLRNRPPSSLNRIKIESVHSELDIKDEGPIIDTNTTNNQTIINNGMQQNYVLVNSTTNAPMNYVVMPNEHPTLPQQSQMLSVLPPVPIQQGYYVQGPHGYFLPGSQMNQVRPSYTQSSNYQPVQPMIIQSSTQPYVTQTGNYVQYQQVGVVPPAPQYSTAGQRPLINPPLPITTRSMKIPPRIIQNKQIVPPLQPRHPVGAVIRSTVPFRADSRGGNTRGRIVAPRNATGPRNVRSQNSSLKPKTATVANKIKTTSLIVLSDSDDEIEMIITEKCDGNTNQKSAQARNASVGRNQQSTKTDKTSAAPTVTAGQSSSKGGLTPQILQRMSQGGISITPVKPQTPAKTSTISATQLVVVVNETGSHYALALPNGSKLILTPEQVAQIRASNGGKLAV